VRAAPAGKRGNEGASITTRHGAEWESNYPHWELLYQAVLQRLRAPTELSESEKAELLYVLARDRKDEEVAEMLARAPAGVEQLIPASSNIPILAHDGSLP
jgi:hypothetical protein